MSPEQEVLVEFLGQLDRIASGVAEDRFALGDAPATLDAFEAMPAFARTASRALLKGFEQYVDTIQRVVRTELRLSGYRLKGMTPLDVAYKAEELGQVSDARAFLALIDLRNELTHEYPDDSETRFARFSKALGGMAFLDDGATRVRRFAETRLRGVDQ